MWDANTESDLAGYRVEFGTTSGSPSTTVDVGNVTQRQFTGLQAGVTYYFRSRPTTRRTSRGRRRRRYRTRRPSRSCRRSRVDRPDLGAVERRHHHHPHRHQLRLGRDGAERRSRDGCDVGVGDAGARHHAGRQRRRADGADRRIRAGSRRRSPARSPTSVARGCPPSRRPRARPAAHNHDHRQRLRLRRHGPCQRRRRHRRDLPVGDAAAREHAGRGRRHLRGAGDESRRSVRHAERRLHLRGRAGPHVHLADLGPTTGGTTMRSRAPDSSRARRCGSTASPRPASRSSRRRRCAR